jgi:hypothetical protein
MKRANLTVARVMKYSSAASPTPAKAKQQDILAGLPGYMEHANELAAVEGSR